MVFLANGIKESVGLTHLAFINNIFEEAGCLALVDALKERFCARHLAIENMKTNEKMAESLASFLKDPRCKIHNLSLNELEVSEASFKLLLESLHHLKNLK